MQSLSHWTIRPAYSQVSICLMWFSRCAEFKIIINWARCLCLNRQTMMLHILHFKSLDWTQSLYILCLEGLDDIGIIGYRNICCSWHFILYHLLQTNQGPNQYIWVPCAEYMCWPGQAWLGVEPATSQENLQHFNQYTTCLAVLTLGSCVCNTSHVQ